MDIYAQNILDRYKEPFFKGKAIKPTIIHKEANHSCGDSVEVKLKLTDDKITAYSFEGHGCAISQSAADIIGDLISDQHIESVLKMKKEDVYEALGIEISLRRSKCALLSLLAVQNALLEHEKKSGRSWSDYRL